jgi:hypothetical protein
MNASVARVSPVVALNSMPRLPMHIPVDHLEPAGRLRRIHMEPVSRFHA